MDEADDAVQGPETGSPYALGYRSGSGLTTWQDIVETGSWYAKRAQASTEEADSPAPAPEPEPEPEPSFAAEPAPQQGIDGVRLAREWAREMSSETGTISGMQQQPLSSSPAFAVPRSSGYAGSRSQAFQAARATRSERRPGLGGPGVGRPGGGRGSRQAHLTLSRIEPWSVLKFSSVAAVVAFVILFVAVLFLYIVLSGMGVFSALQNTASSVTSSQNSSGTDISGWFSASTILGYTALLGVINIVLIPALCTIGAVIYNLIADFFGGIEVTLRESD